VKTDNAQGVGSGLKPGEDATRRRAAVEVYSRNEAALRRIARRFSICDDDADEALQRGLEILLRKAPTEDPRELIKWVQTVVRHEALAVRRERERTLAGPAAVEPEPGMEDWVALLPAPTDGPPERAERQEAVARSREALQALKPQELRALTLLAEGYSYAEIGEITGYSQTKINRCLAEGRERFRRLVARSEDGGRCVEMQPLLSAFCDGEAKPEQVAALREHLRACPRCRATLRAYRAAPAAAAALPLPASLWQRLRDSFGELFGRFGGGGDAVPQAAAGTGAGGVAAVAKIAAVCIGAAGGAAACVAGGLVPNPIHPAGEQDRPPVERRQAEIPAVATPQPEPEPEPEPTPQPKPEPHREPQTAPETGSEGEAAVVEPAPVESEAAEYVPPPEPVAEPAPVASSGGGSPAGEFGP
jgi:RNA polymerase sigma factor (sigma-70 family)